MASTFTKLLIHFVWSTKNRLPQIAPELDADLHADMVGIAANLKCFVLASNGTTDHIHMLVSMSKHLTVIEFAEIVKKSSSRWMKSRGITAFDWQDGYAAFSLGESGVEQCQRYIARQKEHHKKTTFQEELIALLKKYKIPYDDRYIFS